MAQPGGLWQKFRNTPQLAAGIGILAFRQLSGIAAFHKIVTRFYLKTVINFKVNKEAGLISGFFYGHVLLSKLDIVFSGLLAFFDSCFRKRLL